MAEPTSEARFDGFWLVESLKPALPVLQSGKEVHANEEDCK
jgi:hypothetical protein